MSEKRFYLGNNDTTICDRSQGGSDGFNMLTIFKVVDLLNEQQELIEELQVSDEMGWKRAERFEKKCPKELHNKKMYIKRLEYKVQKFKEENEKLRQGLNRKDCRKCGNYCRDKVLDYCLVDEREPSYFSPLKWDYKAVAEKCKYYFR